MGKHNFIGEFVGCYTKTTVESNKIKSSKGKATIKITKVGPGAYLETIIDDCETIINTLAFKNNDILVAQAQSGEGITNTYFKDKHLIHQISNKSPSIWLVKKYKFQKNKCN